MTVGPDSPPLRVGLLGVGRIAHLYHLPILSTLADVEVMAIAEQDDELRESCRSLAPSAALFTHHQALIESSQLDAVVICLPPALHTEAAIASFECGLHVYLEKPLATTLEDGERIIHAWRQAGTIGWIGFNFRFHPLVIEMHDALRNGAVGELVVARASFCATGRSLPAWKRQRNSGGGALLDLASHHFDLLRFVLDQEIVEVNALVGSRTSEEDTAAVQLRLGAGQLVNVLTSISAVEQHRMEIIGTEGEIVFDRYRSSRLRFNPPKRDFSKAARLRASLGTFADFPRAIRDAILPPREQSFERALAAFVAATRGIPSLGPDLYSGLDSLAVVFAAEQAAQSGRKVAVKSRVEAL